MMISLIWAMDDNRLIGSNNGLPWKLPADMKWFRQHTLGKPIVMGRKTYESFGARPLPERTNIVITRDPDYRSDDAVIVHSVDEAIQEAGDAEELVIIGGASFYEQMLARADRLYITHVQGRFEGDAWFPDFDLDDWQEVERQSHAADDRNSHACTFIIYDRKK
jgi:dihydrofolate reductase